jgi:hypothetical protein
MAIVDLDTRFSESQEARYPTEMQWRLNLAWLIGRQYTTVQRGSWRLEEVQAPPWRVRYVSNRILPTWRMYLGRLAKSRPLPEVIPATGEEKDMLSAKVADKLLKYIWTKEKLDKRKAVELYSWMLSCGSAFLIVWWDHDAGDLIELPEAVESEELLANPEKAIQRMGDIRVDVVPPFEIYPDPQARNWDEVRYIFHVKALPVDVLREMFPEHREKIHPEGGLEATWGWYNDPLFTAPSIVQPYIRPLKDAARLIEYYERPSKKFPRGRHAIAVGMNNWIIREDKLPYDHLDIPIIKFDFIPIPSRFWGMSLIEQLIPIQKNLNLTKSMLIENKIALTRPKVLIPTTAGISPDAFTTEAGEKVYYNPFGGRPEPWVPPPIPGYVLSELQTIEHDFMEVSSLHWVSRGMNPPGVRTAAGIAILQEADETPLGPILIWNEQSWIDTAHQVIELARQFYTEPRIVHMHLGDRVEAVEFHRERLEGRFRILIDIGSSIPLSKAARIQFAFELLDRGAFRGPDGRIDEFRLFKFLEMDSAIESFQEDNVDIRHARFENMEMRDSQIMFEPGELDNHPLHIAIHAKAAKEIALEDPNHPALKLIQAHIKAHEELMKRMAVKQAADQMDVQRRIQEIQQVFAQAQAAAAEGPGGPPAPSGEQPVQMAGPPAPPPPGPPGPPPPPMAGGPQPGLGGPPQIPPEVLAAAARSLGVGPQ